MALAKRRLDILEKVTPERERMALDYLIHQGPAIDGMTRRQELSVDGIEFDACVKVIERVKEIALE